MRLEKAESLIRLARLLQGSSLGLSLQEIMEEFSVSRRTAERMRDAVLRLFPEVEEVPSDDREKRWRLRSQGLGFLSNLTAPELASIETAAKTLETRNLSSHASQLRSMAEKAKAAMETRTVSRIEPDLEALTRAEGIAHRPGPREQYVPGVIEALRHAVQACEEVRISYRKARQRSARQRAVQPYGFLFGSRAYLVAFDPAKTKQDWRLFALAGVRSVSGTGHSFERELEFSIDKYAAQSFGVWREEDGPYEVIWRFSPAVADDVKTFLFHPHQEMTALKDGSVRIQFTAYGLLEMAWHAF